jgi:ubiquinone biosynthesis protein UbiJ
MPAPTAFAPSLLFQPALLAINHLLRGEAWARDRLKPFGGKRVLFRASPLPELRLAITAEGMVAAAGADDATDLTLTIRPGALPHLLSGSDALLQHVDISGNADLASTVQFLFRNLKWDAEEDLSKVVGDAAAHRIAGAGRDFLAWQKDALLRTGENLAEYWTEEQPLLARAEEVERFGRDVDTLRDDLARLEARLARLAPQR